MKLYFPNLVTLLLIMISSWALESNAKPGFSGSPDEPAYTLYPVTGFSVTFVETIRYLSWQQPELPGGGIPPELYCLRWDPPILRNVGPGLLCIQ